MNDRRLKKLPLSWLPTHDCASKEWLLLNRALLSWLMLFWSLAWVLFIFLLLPLLRAFLTYLPLKIWLDEKEQRNKTAVKEREIAPYPAYRNWCLEQLAEHPLVDATIPQIHALNLARSKLDKFPDQPGMLILDRLDVSHNLISAMPKIGLLKRLTHLNASNNCITNLPPDIGQLTELQELNLDNNQLTELPAEIGSLVNLRTLSLQDNQLQSLPPELRKLPHLTQIILHGNPALGIPASILGVPQYLPHGDYPAFAKDILDFYFAAQRT